MSAKEINNIKSIMIKFNHKLESYEIDKKFGQLSVDSISHLFPSEIEIIKKYIEQLENENKELKGQLETYKILFKTNAPIINGWNKLKEYLNTYTAIFYDEVEMFQAWKTFTRVLEKMKELEGDK